MKITRHSFLVLVGSDAVAWELAYIPWCYFLKEFSSSDYQQSLLTSATLFLEEEGSEVSLPFHRAVLQMKKGGLGELLSLFFFIHSADGLVICNTLQCTVQHFHQCPIQQLLNMLKSLHCITLHTYG